MTQEIEQVTDFSAIEDAIELWVSTGSTLAELDPIEDDKGNFWSRVNWSGFEFERKRPYAVISIVSDLSPGQSCVSQKMITESSVDKVQTSYSKVWRWSVQISCFQDSYDDDGNAIRDTARQYAKNLVDRYDIAPVRDILADLSIAFHPLNKNIRGIVLPNTDDDKYIHQATIEFHFSGINGIALKDTDFFETIDDPTVTFTGDNA